MKVEVEAKLLYLLHPLCVVRNQLSAIEAALRCKVMMSEVLQRKEQAQERAYRRASGHTDAHRHSL